MNFRQLRYFCEIVACGSAAGAAERLHVAPTAISMQLSMLESALGGQLFDRSRRPMSLTALGRYFYPRAKALLADMKGLEEETRNVAAGRSGVLSIGYTRSSIFTILPRAIRTFSATHPNVKIELITLLSEHQYEQLLNGRIQVGISRYLGVVEPIEGISFSHLLDDPFVVAPQYSGSPKPWTTNPCAGHAKQSGVSAHRCGTRRPGYVNGAMSRSFAHTFPGGKACLRNHRLPGSQKCISIHAMKSLTGDTWMKSPLEGAMCSKWGNRSQVRSQASEMMKDTMSTSTIPSDGDSVAPTSILRSPVKPANIPRAEQHREGTESGDWMDASLPFRTTEW